MKFDANPSLLYVIVLIVVLITMVMLGTNNIEIIMGGLIWLIICVGGAIIIGLMGAEDGKIKADN